MDLTESVSYGRRGELDTVIVNNQYGKAEISLYGAHVLSFRPHKDDKERLWLSPHADLTGNKPIRGGIPICWPWFGGDNPYKDNTLPSHGFLRNQIWALQSQSCKKTNTQLVFVPKNLQYPPFTNQVDVSFTVEIGKKLTVHLKTTNLDESELTFNAALHSYFNVDKVINAQIVGISGDYKDKLNGWKITPTPHPYNITSETDRIHLCQSQTVSIANTNETRVINQSGHDSIVVWNPWTGAASMPDMDAFGYKNMLCIETALTQWKTLVCGESHTLTQVIS